VVVADDDPVAELVPPVADAGVELVVDDPLRSEAEDADVPDDELEDEPEDDPDEEPEDEPEDDPDEEPEDEPLASHTSFL
jgi:hypothetical protein